MLLRENKQGRSGLSRWIAQRKDVISAIRKHAGHSGTLGKGGVGGEVVDEGRETGNAIFIFIFSAVALQQQSIIYFSISLTCSAFCKVRNRSCFFLIKCFNIPK